jgi:DNA-binding MarR family transcriptional regulator
MSLKQELGLPNPIGNYAHEAVLSIFLTGMLLAKEGDRILRPFGLTDSQFNVLMLLNYQSDNGEINQTNLGQMLLVNRSNVTGLVDRMEEAGWVERTADAEDRRINRVRLTAAGREVLSRAETAYFARIEEVMGVLPTDAHARLCFMLERVRDRLRRGSENHD